MQARAILHPVGGSILVASSYFVFTCCYLTSTAYPPLARKEEQLLSFEEAPKIGHPKSSPDGSAAEDTPTRQVVGQHGRLDREAILGDSPSSMAQQIRHKIHIPCKKREKNNHAIFHQSSAFEEAKGHRAYADRKTTKQNSFKARRHCVVTSLVGRNKRGE